MRYLVLLLVFTPIIPSAIYNWMWSLPDEGTAAVGLEIIAPADSTNRIYFIVPFESGSQTIVPLPDLTLVHQPNEKGEACSSATMLDPPGAATASALVFDTLRECYAEEVADIAKTKGYDAVIFRSPFTSPGYTALTQWSFDTNSLPIFEVAHDVPMDNVERVSIGGSSINPIESYKDNWEVVSILRAFNIMYGCIQLSIALHRIVRKWSDRDQRRFNISWFICGIQCISGSLRVIYFAVDPFGLLHVWNSLAQRIFIFLATNISFATTYILGLSIHKSILQVESLSTNGFNRKLIPFGAFLVTIILLDVVATVFLVQLSGSAGIMVLITGINAFIFQVASGLYYVWIKGRVIKSFKKVKTAGNRRLAQIHRMSEILVLSVIPMIGFMLNTIVFLYLFYTRKFQIASLSMGAMFTSLTEICQLLSIPVPQSKSTLASSKVKRMQPRPSGASESIA